MTARPNFYDLLELDPSVDDWSAIQARLDEKQRTWSAEKTGGTLRTKYAAARNLSLIGDIRSTLADAAKRRAEAEAAARRRAEARHAGIAAVDEAIAVFRSGHEAYTESDVQELAKRFAGTITETELELRLRSHGLAPAAVREKGSPPPAGRERITADAADAIRSILQFLGLPTLYDFLELPRQSSPAALCEKATAILNDNQRRGKTDAESTARNDLAGRCRTLFQDAAAKERYDNFLAVEAMEDLRPNIDLAGRERVITAQVLDELVRQGRQRGISAADARAYVEEYAVKRKWKVQREARLPSEALRQCGPCGALASLGARNCAKCGRALEVECPRCGAATPTQNAACERCGAHVGDAALVQALLRDGERLTAEGRVAEALDRFDRALHYWPGWGPATAARERAAARRHDREVALRPVEALAAARRLCEAERELERFARAYGAGGTEALARSIREERERAHAAYERGRRATSRGDGEAALEAYDAALALCTDLEPARLAAASHPPPPPGALAVRAVAGGFHLAWVAAPSARPLTYRVVRTEDAAATGAEDGTALPATAGLSATDAVPEGVAVWYAVYSVRGGIVSAHAAQSGPHLRTAEVRELAALGGDGEVVLRWRRPPGCRRVEVWARSGTPPERGGGGEMRVVAGDELHETGVPNGQARGYRVVAVYDDPAAPGCELRTAGVTATAVPTAPPPPVMDLSCTRDGRTVQLAWTRAPGVAVQLRQAEQLPPFNPGHVIAAADAGRFGRLVASGTGGAAHATLAGPGRTFFVPISVVAGTATVGKPLEVTTLDPVTALTARRMGGGIALAWEWPAGVEEVVVAYAHDGYPTDPAGGGAARATVSRAQYAAARGWELRGAERQSHYFSVFARVPGLELYAPAAHAVENVGQEMAVRYRVKTQWLRKNAWVELQGAGTATLELPALLLVARAGAVPIDPADGQTLTAVSALRLEGGRATLAIPPQFCGSGQYVRLFFRNPADAREIRLLPAEKEQLRLS